MARVQVNGTSPNVQLQPQATPVNTYAQPETPTPTAAEMRAKILEGALSNVSAAVTKIEDQQYREQLALKKEEVAVTASADMIRFQMENDNKIRGKGVDETGAILDEAFAERYKDIQNPYVKTAVMGLYNSYKVKAMGDAHKRIEAEKDARFADDTMLNASQILSTAEAENWDDAKLSQELNGLFKTATSTNRITGVQFNKRLIDLVGNGDPNERGWRYITGMKLDKTGRAEYEAGLDKIRNGKIKSANDAFMFDAKRQAAAIVASGGVKQMKAFSDQLAPILRARGLDSEWLITQEAQAQTRANELSDIHARKVALTRAADYAINNDGFISPDGMQYVDHKGQTHSVPASEIKQHVTGYLHQNPDAPNAGKILTRIVDPVNTKILTDGVAYLTDINNGEMVTLSDGSKRSKKAIAGEKFSLALKQFEDVLVKGGEEAAAKQAGELFDLYIGALALSKSGSTPEDIALGLANRKSGKVPKVTKQQVDTMTDHVLSKTDNSSWLSLWQLGDEGQNTAYVKQQLERLYGLYRQSSLSDESAMQTAQDVFMKTHTLVEQDGVFILVNTNSLSRNTALAGGKEGAPPSEMIQKLGNASKQFAREITQQYPEAIKDKKVFLQPNLLDPNKFTLTFDGGGVVPNSKTYTAAEINQADAQWKLGSKQRGIEMRERIYKDSQVSP